MYNKINQYKIGPEKNITKYLKLIKLNRLNKIKFYKI